MNLKTYKKIEQEENNNNNNEERTKILDSFELWFNNNITLEGWVGIFPEEFLFYKEYIIKELNKFGWNVQQIPIVSAIDYSIKNYIKIYCTNHNI